MEEPEKMFTIPEVAASLGLTEAAVRMAILRESLPFVKMYGRKLVTQSALDEYRHRTQPEGVKRVGRPPKRTEN